MCLGATAIVGASFRAIPTHDYSPDKLAKLMGVDAGELKKVRHMAQQFSSDCRHHREPSEADFNYLMETADKGGNLASEVYWNLLPIKGSTYDKRLIEAARKSAHSKNENEVFSSVQVLHYFGDPHWTQLALSHDGEKSELMQLLVQEAKD